MATDSFHGVDIELTTIEEAVNAFLTRAKAGESPEAYRLVNAYTFALASSTPDYFKLLRGPGVNLPDGKPLAAVMARLGSTQCEQIRGPSFFELCLNRGRRHGIRHYFLGASESTLGLLTRRMKERYPGLEVVGIHSPPFRPLDAVDHRRHDELIRASGADVVWVGMGTPRQDFEARRIADSVGVMTAGVGAAFDFSAGTKRKAPEMWHRLGLEWLFRLVTEPRRLGKRYLVGNAIFLRMVATQAWSRWCRSR